MSEPMQESRSMQRRKAAQKGAPMPTFSPAYTEQDLRIAKEWVYKVHAWRGRSPEFMVGQSERLATEFSRIRSEARAGMREACAKQADSIADAYNIELPDGDLVGHAAASGIAEKIRSLSDLAADEAIERIKREARLEESRSLWNQDFGDAYNGGYLTEKGRDYLRGRIAALSGKETEHER